MSITIEEVRGLGDPQKSYKWRVTLPQLGYVEDQKNSKAHDFLSRAPALRNKVVGIGNLAKERLGTNLGLATPFNFSNFVEEVQGLPFPGVEREAFYEAGRNTYFPGLEDIGSVTLVFYQNESSLVQSYFFKWKRLVINEDGTKNYPEDYKKPISIQLLDGNNQPTFDYRLLGCFPTGSAPYNLTNQTGRLVWAQEFSVDRVEISSVPRESTSDSIIKKLKNTALDRLGNTGDFRPAIDDLRSL